jgi:hypothetical protein
MTVADLVFQLSVPPDWRMRALRLRAAGLSLAEASVLAADRRLSLADCVFAAVLVEAGTGTFEVLRLMRRIAVAGGPRGA